jgi:hypothetical protein
VSLFELSGVQYHEMFHLKTVHPGENVNHLSSVRIFPSQFMTNKKVLLNEFYIFVQLSLVKKRMVPTKHGKILMSSKL